MYIREKVKMQAKLQATSNRISLTYDLYSSLTTDSYGCLTAYFIDNDWNLQKNVLNFFYLPPPYCDTYLAEKIFGLLIDWGIEKKVSTITSNSALINADPVKDLRSKLNASRGLFCGGEYFHIPCCAHIINVIVQDGLKEIDEALHKIRESIKFVKGSKAREQKFLECVTQSSLDVKKGLRQDVSTVWSSTLIMLHHALYYRQAFMQLEISDSSYNGCPSKIEWDNLEKISKLLSVFYDITLVFCTSKYPTANVFFPTIFSAYLRLKQETGNDDECLKTLAMRLLSKLEKYWSDFSIILAIGVILDPRYKFSFVDWCFKKLLGDDGVQESTRVKDKLFSVFTMYTTPTKLIPSPKPTIMPDESCYNDQFNASDDSFSRDADDFFKEFDSLAREDAFQQKSQMELYLDEPRINRKSRLDVPTYWKVNQYRFPEVAAMARDILSIPFTTVNKVNYFDENGRMLDQYNSALKPDMIEALICTRDWLYERMRQNR
ncbi:hypothetical protein HPP92_009399 [Vanilla planifolia]|uniref:Transposase n=1 Tax=Vanilla planifolia TaxID=51239 RepID=A0A835RE75_VANPL|nr:hypothetical protein HPP92_009399 [Vanilla planifolia]